MRLPAYSSDRPEVLDAWTMIEAKTRAWIRVCNEIKNETGREVMVSQGWGDERPLGLTCKYDETPPEGWRWDNARRRQYIQPRAKGPGSKEAQAVMQRLNVASPQPRSTLDELFGTPPFILLGLTARTSGIGLLQGKLWIYYGEGELDKPWDGGDYFTQEPLSAYHAACEATIDEAVS